MDSLKDLLVSKSLDEPTELVALRSFCNDQYNIEPKIQVKNDIIWLSLPNGLIATEVRMRQSEIIKRCGITKKLRIKIG
jgi:hypothetical protein